MKKKSISAALVTIAFAFIFSVSANATLVANYQFSGNAVDGSGNGHNGTVVGATLANDRYGNPLSAYSFDGNDYIIVPDSNDFSFGSGDFTISSWAQISSYGADGGYYLMGHSEGPGNTGKWIFWLGDDSIKFVSNPTGWLQVGTTKTFGLNSWYQVAVRRSGNELSAFVNGSVIGTVAFNGTLTDPNAPLIIGSAEFDRPNRQFRGLIDDVYIYNHALSDSEMLALGTHSPVPEPATILLFGSGLVGLVGMGRKKFFKK